MVLFEFEGGPRHKELDLASRNLEAGSSIAICIRRSRRLLTRMIAKLTLIKRLISAKSSCILQTKRRKLAELGNGQYHRDERTADRAQAFLRAILAETSVGNSCESQRKLTVIAIRLEKESDHRFT